MLIGSHIKRWKDSSDAEKLDENNGLLLCAHHDALFDKHLISFEDNGDLIVSTTLTASEQKELQIAAIPPILVSPGMKPYLAEHRSKLK
jgi:predicted restriction endonuclease